MASSVLGTTGDPILVCRDGGDQMNGLAQVVFRKIEFGSGRFLPSQLLVRYA